MKTNVDISMSKSEQDDYNFVEDRYGTAKNDRVQTFEDARELEELYLGHIENTKNPWKSAVFDPESFEKVERMVSHVFSSEPRGRFLPMENSDATKADIADAIFRYQWNRPGQNMFLKIKRMGLGAGIFGASYGLLTWRFEKRKIKVPIDEFGMEFEEVEIDDWDDPYFQDLYYYDTFPDPSAVDGETMNHFIFNEYVTLDSLEAANANKSGQKRYVNLGRLKKKIGDGAYYASEDVNRRYSSELKGLPSGEGVYNRILLRRYFDKHKWITVAPDYGLVIESRDNPYWHGELPIHVLTDHEYINQLEGRGEIEPIKRLQKGLNNVLNQRLDNVRLIMQPVVKVRGNSKYAHTWKWKPGYKWQVDSIDDIDQFQIKDVTGGTFLQTTNYFKDAIAQTLGNYDVLSRGQSAYERTATEAKMTSQEQNARFKQKEMVADAFIKKLSTQWLKLNKQYLTKPKTIRIAGQEAIDRLLTNPSVVDMNSGTPQPKMVYVNGIEREKLWIDSNSDYGFLIAGKEDLAGEFDFVVETGSMSLQDPTDTFSNLSLAYNLLLQSQPYLQQEGTRTRFRPLLEKILFKLGIRNVDGVFEAAGPETQMMVNLAKWEKWGSPQFQEHQVATKIVRKF
jgi:hypothetical protein